MPHFNKLGRTARVVLVVTGLLIAVLVVCEIAGWPFLRAPAQRFMSKQLDRTVRLDAPFKLHLLGGIGLDVKGLWISSPAQFDAPYLIDASNISLGLRYSDLLDRDSPDASGQATPLRIKSLRVDEVDTYLIRDREGNATWQFHKQSKTPTPFPRIETLVVRAGKAKVGDQVSHAELQLQFNTREGAANAKPLSKLQAEGKFREHPVKGALATNGFLPIVTQQANAPPIASKGWVDYSGVHLDFDGQISDLFGNKKVSGKFSASGPSLGIVGDFFNIALPTTKAFKLNGDVEKDNDLLHVNIAAAHVGASELSADFKYDTSQKVAKLTGDLRSKHFVLADLLPAFGAATDDGTRAKPRAGGLVIPNRPLDLPSLHRMDADVMINMDYVDLGKYFSQPIAPFKAHLSLGSGKLSLAKIYAHTADGTLAGTISVDARDFKEDIARQEHIKPADLPTWKIDLAWRDINLAKWLQASKNRQAKAKQEGKEAPVPYLTGTLNGKTDLVGKGRATAELLASLNGHAALYINHGSISHLVIEAFGLDVAQGLGLVVKGDESLPLQCAVMDFKATDGIARPDVALMDTPVTLILSDGSINLGKEQLDLRFIAKPKNMSPFTVRSPILITGTFANPKVKPEAAPIAARVLGGIALAFINPLAAILPFLDPGSNSNATCSKALAEFNSKAPISKQPAPKASAAKPGMHNS